MPGIGNKELAALRAPTPENEIKTRPGRGNSGPLSYVDARWVMDRLDEAVGPENWTRTHVVGPDGKVACEIAILMAETGWVIKGDGAGETDIEGEKGAFSDAFKRAAVNWGVARDLYGRRDAVPAAPAKPQKNLRPNNLSKITREEAVYHDPEEKFREDFVQKAQAAQAQTFKAPDALKIKVRVKAREKGIKDDALKALAFSVTGKESSKEWTVDDAERVLVSLDGGAAALLADAK